MLYRCVLAFFAETSPQHTFYKCTNATFSSNCTRQSNNRYVPVEINVYPNILRCQLLALI